MKRKILAILLVLACTTSLAGCQCKHEWVAADCVTPKTCTRCQETEGASLGHDWLAATCEEAQTCKVCGAVEGIATGHSWVEATCMAPKHCENCDLTEGELTEHLWQNATTEEPKTCSVCGLTEGNRIMTDDRFKTEKCRDLFGSWQYEKIMSADEIKLEGYVDEVPLVAVVTFAEDGQITLDLAFKDAKQFAQDLHNGTVEAIYRQFENQDMTREEADTAFLDTYGMNVEDYSKAMWAVVDWDALFHLYETAFVYYVDGGKLYVSEDWDGDFAEASYSIYADQMTLTNFALTGDAAVELTKIQ